MEEGYVLQGGNGVRITPLEATEDGTYTAKEGQAFNPVTVKSGGGSGGGVLVVNATKSGETITLDKTFLEIYDAMDTGVVVIHETGEDGYGNHLIISAYYVEYDGYAVDTLNEEYIAESENDYPSRNSK